MNSIDDGLDDETLRDVGVDPENIIPVDSLSYENGGSVNTVMTPSYKRIIEAGNRNVIHDIAAKHSSSDDDLETEDGDELKPLDFYRNI